MNNIENFDYSLIDKDCLLLRQMFSKTPDEASIKIITDGIDVDNANLNYMLFLSILGYRIGWKWFPERMIPRLMGFHRYYQVSNSLAVPWLAEQIKTLSEAGIEVMLLKGIALRTYYTSSTPRMMSDYDIAVSPEDYDRAVELILSNGNKKLNTVPHSFTVENEIAGQHCELDIHRWIFKYNGERDTDIWHRSIAYNFYGCRVRILSPEDMLIHLLDTQTNILARDEFPERRLKWLFDCRSVEDCLGGIDLDSLYRRAEEFGVTPSVRMTLLLYSECFPDSVKQEDIESVFPEDHRYQLYLEGMEMIHNAFERFEKYDYVPYGVFTPLRIVRAYFKNFQMYRGKKKCTGEKCPWNSFKDYLLDLSNTKSTREFLAAKISRFSLIGD